MSSAARLASCVFVCSCCGVRPVCSTASPLVFVSLLVARSVSLCCRSLFCCLFVVCLAVLSCRSFVCVVSLLACLSSLPCLSLSRGRSVRSLVVCAAWLWCLSLPCFALLCAWLCLSFCLPLLFLFASCTLGGSPWNSPLPLLRMRCLLPPGPLPDEFALFVFPSGHTRRTQARYQYLKHQLPEQPPRGRRVREKHDSNIAILTLYLLKCANVSEKQLIRIDAPGCASGRDLDPRRRARR